MESRPFKPYKVIGGSIPPQKPKRELPARRKSFGPKSRTTAQKKDILPLTPLHRLQRFKAIRDKNLGKNIGKFRVKKIFSKRMDSEVIHEQEQVYSKNVSSDTNTSAEINEKVEHADENCITNGQNVLLKEPAQAGVHGINDVNEQNGNVITNGENGHLTSEKEQDDGKVSEHHQLFEEINEGDADKGKVDGNERRTDDVLPYQEKEINADRDGGSTSSESTFTSSNKEFLLRISSEDLSDGGLNKEDISEEENDIDIEGISSTEDEKISEVLKLEEARVEEEEKEVRKEYVPSVSSASSYKTAYGSLSRISGRRGMARGRKRKAEDTLEPRSSLSQPSPGWRFVPSAFSKLWSPSSNLDVLSSSGGVGTPSRSIEDSMAVNYNDDSINFNLNDDLFSDTKETPPPSKKSQWGCSIM